MTTEHSKRPAMAFVSFTRDEPQEVAGHEPPGAPHLLVADDNDVE